MLSGVATVYGKSSSQYKMAYGSKRTTRKRALEAATNETSAAID
jgi:hypothetical protein